MRAIPVLCVTALAVVLSACSPEPAPAPAPAPTPPAAAPAPAPLTLDDEKVLNIYNWPDYIPPETIAAFEKETGIKVNYDTYESNETMHAKVTAGNTGYDIAVTGNVFAKQQVEGGIMQPLDKSKLTHYGNLDKNLMAKLAQDDPGNAHLIPWAWGFTTVGINRTKAEKALSWHAHARERLGPGLQPRIHRQAQVLRHRLSGFVHRRDPAGAAPHRQEAPVRATRQI